MTVESNNSSKTSIGLKCYSLSASMKLLLQQKEKQQQHFLTTHRLLLTIYCIFCSVVGHESLKVTNLYRRMMSHKTSSLLCQIFLLMITALGNEWSVKYSQLNLCALKGSTVIMKVTYTHPPRLTVTQRFWFINPGQGKEPTDLYNVSGYSGRVTYITDVQNHFPLRLSDVKKTDEQMYCFRIRTNEEKERYLGYPGVTLSVTDLHLQIAPAEVTEGQSVVLTCKTTCSLTDPTFIWYKTGRNLTTKTNKNNEVRLQSVSSEDAGSYRCAVRGYEHLHSPDQRLRVRYRPKNISVSISPSGEIVEGSSVTLTCSSDANPPVQNYTWFKGKTSVGKEKTYNISKISSEDSGEYKCKCSNKVGHRYSNNVTLNVLYPPKKVSVSISPSGEIVEDSSVTLTCSSDANPPVHNYTWFKGNTTVGKEKTYNISKISSEDSGEYKCRSSNEVGHQDSNSVTLNVLYPPKNVSVSISPSSGIVENSPVTLTCSSDANPLLQNYTWFKGITQVGNEKTYNISKISSKDSGEYKCRISNKVGPQFSNSVTLNVLYPPKNVSVSISPSGDIMKGSSVTLTCSSDANPPVQNYTWFKVKESSPVGSGQSYRAVQSGQYYCEAQNKHGSERSAAVPVTINDSLSSGVYAGLGVVLVVCICLTVTFLCIRKKTSIRSRPDESFKQDNLYDNIAVTNPVNTASTNQDEVLYASVVHQRAVDPGNVESSALKASGCEDGEVQYASVRFKCTAADYRPMLSNAEDSTVIYSRVK